MSKPMIPPQGHAAALWGADDTSAENAPLHSRRELCAEAEWESSYMLPQFLGTPDSPMSTLGSSTLGKWKMQLGALLASR